ncbi:MAG: Gfo/Idh/MocA family oxidoreductase [Cyanobacteria bacterium NC_groundwater_1444_Ag_S-0.65um_54_12]|nr:Gfo/Idh/MocA family oxidoreductase [Cyanobacteria bacterium NC_groundwater_1444_Ag_S-0.65um_54_12]
MIRVAVIGAGYWGPNWIRNLHELNCLGAVCDSDPEQLTAVQARWPVPTTTSYEAVLADPNITAVVIATPVHTHHRLARQALLARKTVLVEKPLALTTEQAEELVAIGAQSSSTLMVGHLLEYHPAFLALRERISAGYLGDLRHIRCSRLNLGKLRQEENVLWSFAPHDLSLILRLIGQEPTRVNACGYQLLGTPREDTVYVDLEFESGISAHVHVSWLEPCKLHQFVVIGSRRMAIFNDSLTEGKLRIYDKGFTATERGWTPRNGDEEIINYPPSEPMRAELEDFLSACRQPGHRPLADGQSGVRVVRALERISEVLAARRPLQTAATGALNRCNCSSGGDF